MKILLVQNRFYPAVGGGEKHTYLLSKYLAKKGHEVTVYTTTSLSKDDVPSMAFSPPFILKPKMRADLPNEEVIENVTVKRFDMKFRFWSFNWIPEMFRAIKGTVSEFDIIHAHGYHISSSLVGCYYAKKSKKPFILTSHDLIIPDDLPPDAKLFKKAYDRTFGKYLLKNTTGLIALTEDHLQQYTNRGGDITKIRIIPNAIEVDKYENKKTNQNTLAKYGVDINEKVLLFVGRIDKYKGIQDVIESMPTILEEYSDIRFIVVGIDYGYKGELERVRKTLDIGDRVIFTGNVPEEELIELYKRADIFVFPSKMEGFGIVLLEAMVSGTLCIAYPIPSVRKVIKNNENGVLVKDRKELRDKILFYLDDTEERRRIEASALKYVEKYDIKNIVSSIEKVYKEVLN